MMNEAVMNMIKIDKIKDTIAEIDIKESDKAIILNLIALNSSKSLGTLKRKLKAKYEDAYNLLILLDEFSQEQIAEVLKEMPEIPKEDILEFCKKLEIAHPLGMNMVIAKDQSILADIKKALYSPLDKFSQGNCLFVDIDYKSPSYKETELLGDYKLIEYEFVLYGLYMSNVKQISEILDKQKDNPKIPFNASLKKFLDEYKNKKVYKTAKKFAKEIYKDKCDDTHIIKALGALVESGLI